MTSGTTSSAKLGGGIKRDKPDLEEAVEDEDVEEVVEDAGDDDDSEIDLKKDKYIKAPKKKKAAAKPKSSAAKGKGKASKSKDDSDVDDDDEEDPKPKKRGATGAGRGRGRGRGKGWADEITNAQIQAIMRSSSGMDVWLCGCIYDRVLYAYDMGFLYGWKA